MEFIKEQLKSLDKLKIIYHSIKLEAETKDGKIIFKKDHPDRICKKPSMMPKYQNIKLESKYIKNYNSCIVFCTLVCKISENGI